MSTPRYWPESTLVDTYLAAAAADHTGHKILDLAVWYGLLQNFINRRHIKLLGQPFRVHFFMVATSSFGKSTSLEFGFRKFLGAYDAYMDRKDPDPSFVDLSGQNTAAGLIDLFNANTDQYSKQILTAWVDETTFIFPKFSRQRDQDIGALMGRVLFGVANFRFVRERSNRSGMDCVRDPIINACFPATPEQYTELMAGTSSSDILRRFMLISPDMEEDRSTDVFERYANRKRVDELVDQFCPLLNALDMQSQNPNIEKEVFTISADAKALITDRFKNRLKNASSDEERYFFRTKHAQIMQVAAMNALSRISYGIEEHDTQYAWNLMLESWEGRMRLVAADPGDEAMTASQKQRRAAIKRIVRVVALSGRDGITKRQIQHKVHSLRYFTANERDEIFNFLEEECFEIFQLTLPMKRGTHGVVATKHYFSTKTWSVEEAVEELELMQPAWSPAVQGYIDAIGNVHSELKDCIGYRPEWEASVESSGVAALPASKDALSKNEANS